ncbi:Alpha/Beta hydrolase protein [Hygrophoropsis aurantiaca]|uniref:Alpha/Beta hydrolase protein n=1 Tax=Hygrophoropsis aurantiaca TaxID=72124 RepID=A0ACB8AB83_9AGAM|nr:Alpha/Beta hydrolase protein [Hygrophoropsis aurantiaca]
MVALTIFLSQISSKFRSSAVCLFSRMSTHISQELQNGSSVSIETRYGPIKGGRAANGAAAFLEVPYALPPVRFEDPVPLPPTYRYEDKAFIYDTKHAFQPSNDGQGAATPHVDRVGRGEPSEDPLFVNIVCPSTFTPNAKLPVKAYIHGGFLQFGSPHGLSNQAQYIAEARNEVWVTIGYRLSVFGFLACDEPKVTGNFGFKDQWLALQWVQENIASFGGDPTNVQLSGLSAGAHSVHQILHHISRLPPGQNSPIRSAQLQSNALLTIPKTPTELRSQFIALCKSLNLDPSSPDILATLRDRTKVPASAFMHVIETDAVGIENGTYRGCLDGSWLATTPDPMTWQRTGDLARNLLAKGLKSIAIGDLKEEWYLYAIAHPIYGPKDIFPNILRYYPEPIVERLVLMYDKYKTIPDSASAEVSARLIGEILSDGQVHLPVRMFMRDFQNAGFPVFRYEIRWTPEQIRPHGWVTHGTDRVFWALRKPVMSEKDIATAIAWLDAIDKEYATLEKEGKAMQPITKALTLSDDQTISWKDDKRWDSLIKIATVLPGEGLY